MKRILTLLLLAFLAMAWPSFAESFYVDSVAGNDSNDGSIGAPYKTLSMVQGAASVGACIYLKAGCTFYESCQVPTNSHIMPYSLGPMPIVSGVTNLSALVWTPTPLCTNTWQCGLDVPVEVNSYASLTHSNVLMVWTNNVRLGARWDLNAGYAATNKVDGNPGSFWYDRANNLLYVSANPSNVTIEASIRTLALHGGDGFTVEKIQAEKAYAQSAVGQQGYQLLGYAGGTYRKCRAFYSWNHNAGVANSISASALTFDSCWAHDAEYQSVSTPTLFVAYKGAGLSIVLFTNCLATMPSLNASYQLMGFYTHDTGSATNVQTQFINCKAQNLYYGFQGAANRLTNFSGCVAVGCKTGAYIVDAYPVKSFSAYSSVDYGVSFIGTGTFTIYDSKLVNSGSDVVCGHVSGATLNVTNCVMGTTNAVGAGIGLNGNGRDTVWNTWSNSFYGLYDCMDYGHLGSGDYNNYYGMSHRVASDFSTPSPGYFATASAWKTAAAPLDANATGVNPNYPASFFTYTITDPTAPLVSTATTATIGTLRSP